MISRRPRIRFAAIAALAIAGTVLLAGCAGSPYAKDYAGTPPGSSAGDEFTDTPTAVWLGDGKTIALTTFGSSTCPNAPVSVSVVDATNLKIELKQQGGEVCTADIAPHTYELPKPGGLDATKPVAIDLGNATTITLAPAS